MSDTYNITRFEETTSQTSLTVNKRKSGCHVTLLMGFVLVLIAIAIAVGVGIIVHFAGPARNLQCNCHCPEVASPSTSSQKQQCVDWAAAEDTDICSACAATNCSTPMTTGSTTTPSTGTNITTTSTTPTTVAPTEEVSVRLPLHLVPNLYTIELQPFIYEGEPETFTFDGSVKIEMTCMEDSNNITLHSNNLNISSIKVMDSAGNQAMYVNHTFDSDRHFIVIETQPMMAGKKYFVEMTYSGPLTFDYAGFHLNAYELGNETIYFAMSQMHPTDARQTFPCFDEPALKAEFDITLVRKSHMVALSNMPVKNSETRADDWVADHFQRTVKMSTYILAFIVCELEHTEVTTKNGVKVRVWTRPEVMNQTSYGLSVAVEVLEFFEEYFSSPYPLPKLDMISFPDVAATAMENWGLTVFSESSLLFQPGVNSEGDRERVAVDIGHAMAHNWFGNLVTPSWWDDLWMNEGFADYLQYLGVDHVHPDWKIFDLFVVENLHYAMDVDALVWSHPLHVSVSYPHEINGLFDSVTYYKGASVVRMVQFIVGEDTFRKGLQKYLTTNAYGAVSHDALWDAIGDQALTDGKPITNIKEIMDTWILQMNFPTVSVTYDREGQISVTQSRFLLDPGVPDPGNYISPYNYTWEIPFTFTTSFEKKFNKTETDIFMLNKESSIHTISNPIIGEPGDNAWVLGNVHQHGLYRVNYDERNWKALINQLNTDHEVIAPINRAELINDAWSMARSGDVSMEIALRTTEYLHKEKYVFPWWTASYELGLVSGMISKHPLYGSFSKFMRNITANHFKDIGLNNTGATHLESYMRSYMTRLACLYGIKECVEEAKRLYKQWMDNPSVNPIDPGLKHSVYCTAVREGGVDEWDFAFQQYKLTSVAADQARLLNAMSCTKEIWILNRLLEMSLDENEIPSSDTISVIYMVSSNTIGRSVAWDFFRSKWDFLVDEASGLLYLLPYYILGITRSFSTTPELQSIENFMEDRPDVELGYWAFEQALETTKSNIQWMTTNEPIIKKWLADQGF